MSTVAVDRASNALGRFSLCEAHAPEAHAPEAPSEGDDTVCFVCKRGDDEASLLLCDGAGPCPRAAHTHCLGMESVPEGDCVSQVFLLQCVAIVVAELEYLWP